MGNGVLEGRDEGLVFVDLDVVLKLSEVRIVVVDFYLLLVPVRLHEIQRFLSAQFLLLKLIEVLRLFEDHLLKLSFPLF